MAFERYEIEAVVRFKAVENIARELSNLLTNSYEEEYARQRSVRITIALGLFRESYHNLGVYNKDILKVVVEIAKKLKLTPRISFRDIYRDANYFYSYNNEFDSADMIVTFYEYLEKSTLVGLGIQKNIRETLELLIDQINTELHDLDEKIMDEQHAEDGPDYQYIQTIQAEQQILQQFMVIYTELIGIWKI